MSLPKNIKITKDRTQSVYKGIALLASNRVMAGVPASTASRKDDGDSGPLNNAEIMKIHEDGAPEVNIPARPVVYPAIKSIRNEIPKMLGAAGVSALNGKADRAMKQLMALGLLAQNALRERITEGPFVPLSPKTIANRFRQRRTKGMRAGEVKYLDLIAKGSSPADAQVQADIKPLINTGQLRRALTFVIRKIRWSRR